jgi:quercetin dioxygenase-like cupin family protein
MIRRQALAACLGLALCLQSGGAFAGVHKTTLQSQDFPPPIYRTVTVDTVIDRGSVVAPHTHPGLETAFIVAGKARLEVAGASPRTLSAGQSFAIPRMTVHSVTNIGTGPLTIVSTYVVDKSKPISSPAVMPR